jgi:MoaA/NifB/PqqE/SkfB family radical SAM enzyme
MKPTGLHLLLTYQCTFECDHCFVWGSPFQSGTLTLANIKFILQQAERVPSVRWIYFEGGEPFLYYPILVKGARSAFRMGFQVGIVSNAYWATSVKDALAWLKPLQGFINDFSVSSDLFHYGDTSSQQVQYARIAAEYLKIPVDVISVAQPETINAAKSVGQLPAGESGIMYRGRAAEKLAERAEKRPWQEFTNCPYEDLREPGRVHLDPFGNLHICQGVSIGNLYEKPLEEICNGYDPDRHPITGHILKGGPVRLVEHFELPHEDQYADACHLCYQARKSLRARFPEILGPDQMYGLI